MPETWTVAILSNSLASRISLRPGGNILDILGAYRQINGTMGALTKKVEQ